MKIIPRLCFVACLFVAAVPRDACAQSRAAAATQVGQLFDQAQAAFAKGDKQGAYEAYRAAWALQKSYDIAGNLGNVELKLGKYRDAAEHLTFALESFPPTGDPAQQRALEKRLADAVKEVGRVRLVANVDDASLTIDGRLIGVSPLPSPVFVDPGAVTIEAKRAGYTDARVVARVEKGSAQDVTVTLVRLAPERRSVVPGAVLGGTAGAALVVGIVLEVLGATKRATVKSTSASIEAEHHSCVAGARNYDTRCPDLISTAHSSDALHDAGVGVLIGGGAAALGTVAYFLWPAAKRSTPTGLHAAPSFSASGGGLVVSGAF